jgi:uncharacterized membrane protein YkvA (DUF1232 family)
MDNSQLENEEIIVKYSKYYSEEKFQDKILKIAKSAGVKVLYPALILYFSLVSKNFPKKEKYWIIGALGYLILPFDIIPDFIPVLGYIDDLIALIFVIKKTSDNITPDITEKAKAKVRDIFGKVDESEFRLI